MWYFFVRNNQVIDRPRTGSAIVLFGDSLARGAGASRGGDLATLLAARLGQEVLNEGQNGDTTALALERLAEDVLERDPKIVIIILGGNDLLSGRPAEETGINLGEIIDRLHARGAAVLLAGIRGGEGLADPYAAMYARVAAAKRTSFVPSILSGILGNPALMADELHPNDNGYRVIANRLEPVLRQMAGERGTL